MRPERPRLPVLLAVGAALLLLFAVVAAATRGRNPFGRPAGGSGPSADFVGYAWTTALTVCGLLLVTAIVLTIRGPRVRTPRPTRRRRHWSTILLFGLAALALLIRPTIHRPQQNGTQAISREPVPARTGRLPPPQTAERASFRWGAFAAIVVTAAGLAALAVIASRRRDVQHADADGSEEETALALSDVLDDSLDDLRREPDLRKAVIAAYARMERALAAHGLARARWETPLEYMGRVLVGLSAGRAAVTRLTTLFEQAKFSGHRLAPAMREEAIDALVTVRDDLRRTAAARDSPALAAP